jgi:hypothetical protein
MADWPRGDTGRPMLGSGADAGEQSGSAGTPATRASAQAAAPRRPGAGGRAATASTVASRERRRAVETRGSACLCVSARLPYPYDQA